MTLIARYALLPLAALQFFVPLLPQLGIGTSVGDAASLSGPQAEQPIGAAFAIWGIIFTLLAIFALYAAIKDEPLSRRLAPPLAIVMLGNVIWMLVSQGSDIQLLDHALLVPIIIAAWVAAYRFDQMRGMGGSPVRLIADAASGMLSGWLAVAMSISVPLSVRTLMGQGATDWPWFMVWAVLVPAVLLAFLFARYVSQSLWFFVALGWGLLGIVLNAWFVTDTQLIAYVVGGVGLAVIGARLLYGARGSRT